ncbi:GAF and ANTAR domain-containing protein [Isoptericola hypogeus]|uniref:GAF and ANTAR domain-containing protein n=1 Tax=Isoptericola hypogeus TaxID=300179 RepID=A0ABN2JFW1_9MICO
MTRTPADSLADAAGTLLHDHDVADLLLRLTQDAMRFAGGDAAGVLVRLAAGPFEVLSATSHTATHLELYQTHRQEGPCVDVLDTHRLVAVSGPEAIVARWPAVGPAIVEAGFASVHAFPLVWQGGAFGGLNVFAASDRGLDAGTIRTTQGLADMLTLAIVQPDRLRPEDVDRRLARALDARVVVEQAKGALAHQLGIDVARAYDVLMERSVRAGTPLTHTARAVLEEAQLG